MSKSLKLFFRLKGNEWSLVLPLGIILLSNSLAMQVSEITAVSNFLSTGGVNNILLVWVVDAFLTIIFTGGQSLIVDRFKRIDLMKGTTFGFVLAFVVIRMMFTFHFPGWLNYSLLYLLVSQQVLIFPLIFWIFANDLFTPSQTQRLFPLIASWGLTGKLLGIAIAAFAPSVLSFFKISLEELLSLNTLIYLLVYLIIMFAFNKEKIREINYHHEPLKETLTEGWGFLCEVPAFRYLMFSIVAMVVCDALLEFRFLTVSNAVFNEPAIYQKFYSFYYLVRLLFSLLVQAFFANRIIEKMTLKNIFFVLPSLVLSGASLMIISPGIISSLTGVLLQKIPLYTIDESARKAYQALVPEERRGRVSLFMDNYLYAGGTILGAAIAGLVVVLGIYWKIPNYFYIYLAVAVISALLSLGFIFQMRQVYDTSLFNWRLKRRQRGKSVLDKIEF